MDDIQLPAEVQELLGDGGASPSDDERIAGITQTIISQRDEAVQGRQASGIEQQWMEAEEAYLGIDDENRGEFEGSKWAKPYTTDGGLTKRANSSDGVRATAFVRMTARYVDAGAAKVCEIALPIDGKAFSLKPTPVPELAASLEDDSPVMVGGQQAMKPPEGEGQEPQPLTVADLARNQQAIADKKAKKAEQRIYDWQVEYNHEAEMRKVVFDGARCGSGVLKGPIPETSKGVKFSVANGVGELVIVQKQKPVARWIDFWNLFPDPGCGESIHDGEYVFERDGMLPAKLRGLLKDTGGKWRVDAINQVLDEGPEGHIEDDGTNSRAKNQAKNRQFTVWHYYGQVKRKDFETINGAQAGMTRPDQEYVFVIATLVNDKIIRLILNPLESGSYPYLVFNWRRRSGHWAGVGIGEQIRTPQRIINAATRRMLDNAGKSAGSITVADPDGIQPATGNVNDWRLTGGDNLFWRQKGAAGQDVRELFQSFQIPNVTQQLMLVVEYAFRLAEEQSNIPLITQGQSGDTTPDTFGGQQLQDNNANQLLRDVGFGLHDSITDPLGHRMYEWLLMDPDIPDDEKGDLQVDISGAVALIEKALQRQFVIQMMPMLGRPGSRLDPAKFEENLLRMNRMVPSDFQYDDEQWKKMQEAPPPVAPQIEAAKIRAEAQVQVAQSRDQLAAERIRVDTDRDTAYNNSLAQRAEQDFSARIAELELRRELAMLEYAQSNKLTLDQIKAQLAETTMKLQVQRELAGADGKGPQVATPPTEPPGRADPGQAYQE